MSAKPYHAKVAAIRKEHGPLAESLYRSSPLVARQLEREAEADSNAREARREAARRELLASEKYAPLAQLARHGDQALTLARAHRPEIRDLHREMIAQLDALDEPEPPQAA